VAKIGHSPSHAREIDRKSAISHGFHLAFTQTLTPGVLSCKNRGALNTGTSDGVKSITLLTATCIVVANMIGTGIFTSLGFQVGDLTTGFSILALWFIGGVCALCGALSYAELGAALPRSGGEYHLLGAVYHPALGFLAGWISATVGFAAPTALSAIAFGQYAVKIVPNLPALPLPGLQPVAPEKYLAFWVILISTLFLLRNVRLGAVFQNTSTILKVALVLLIIGAGFFVAEKQPVSFLPSAGDGKLIVSGPFAISLVYVMYAYLGWNASIYLAGEVRDPARVIPRSVILGTVIVMVLYLAVNAVFLISTPVSEMAGKVEVGLIAGNHLFGASGAKIMAGLICAGLIATISAMIWIGARVMMVMGEDMRLLRPLARCTKNGVPVIATLMQFGIAVLLLRSSFSDVTTYVQFSLQICSSLVVLGVIVLRFTRPNLPRPYKTWGYPVTPIIFLLVSGWMLINMWRSHPRESLQGLGMMALGLILYAISPSRPPAVESLAPQ
jgi:APA family basic amino acid/polyamine antiporter